MATPLIVLGATGSIGSQTLAVAERLGFPVAGLAANRPSAELAALARSHPDADVVVCDGNGADRSAFGDHLGRTVRFGSDEMAGLAGRPGHIVVNAVVGAAGLTSTIAALDAGNRVALANKESMVAAGPLVREAAKRGEGELIPVDSEHSALHQCLAGDRIEDVARLILTASGGPFRGRRRSELAGVTPSQALAHPTWDMGGRITIDSATLVNKGLEVIEAHHLFGIAYDRIEVVIHPQSILHSAVELVDGALKAHLGHPDMRIPIQYALTYPVRADAPGAQFSLTGVSLEFETPDRETFPALDLAYRVGGMGGTAPAVLNAADEVAVAAFLAGAIGFLDIVAVIETTLSRVDVVPLRSIDDVFAADAEARRVATEIVAATVGNGNGRVG